MKKFFKYLDPRRWEREKRITFFINICVGLAMVGVMFYLSRSQYMEKLLNPAIDKMIKQESTEFVKQYEQCMRSQSPGKSCAIARDKFSDKIVFIDIDHKSYKEWREPVFIPRSKIAHFLKVAEDNGAKVVVLDVLFENPSFSHQEDNELRNVLEGMTRRKSPLKMVFPVTLRESNGTIRRNIFQDIIERNPNFQLGEPALSFSTSDKVIRYIRYYGVTNPRKDEEQVIWSVPVLAWALYNDALHRLKEREPDIIQDRKSNQTRPYPIKLDDGSHIDVANSELFSNRIRFALLPPGTIGGEEEKCRNRTGTDSNTEEQGGNLFEERILPDQLDPLKNKLRDKIVVIGTSSKDKEAWYPTPIGDMAGFYIIGNAINMMVYNWQINDAPIWVTISLQFLFIVVAAYMFVYFQPKTVRRGTTLLITVVLIPVTYFFYSVYGIFINVIFIFINCVFPMLVMNWKSMVGEIETTIKAIRACYGKLKTCVIRVWSSARKS